MAIAAKSQKRGGPGRRSREGLYRCACPSVRPRTHGRPVFPGRGLRSGHGGGGRSLSRGHGRPGHLRRSPDGPLALGFLAGKRRAQRGDSKNFIRLERLPPTRPQTSHGQSPENPCRGSRPSLAKAGGGQTTGESGARRRPSGPHARAPLYPRGSLSRRHPDQSTRHRGRQAPPGPGGRARSLSFGPCSPQLPFRLGDRRLRRPARTRASAFSRNGRHGGPGNHAETTLDHLATILDHAPLCLGPVRKVGSNPGVGFARGRLALSPVRLALRSGNGLRQKRRVGCGPG